MRKTFTLLLGLLFGATLLFGQTAHKLESVTENFQIFWIIDSPEDLIWLTDTANLDPDNDATPDFDSVGSKWDANYRLGANIEFDPDSSKVDWNNDGTVDIAGTSDSVGLAEIGNWTSPTETVARFGGTFDGQYYTIHNVYKKGLNRGGLISTIQGAQIENVILLNFRNYADNGYQGGIVGRATYEPGVGDDNLIKRCWVEGTFMFDESTTDNLYSAGIVGRFQYGTISECVSIVTGVANITGQRRFSGIIGQMEGASSVSDCYAIVDITAEEQFGGLLGRVAADPTATISNSYAVSTLTGKEPADQRGGFAGDIVGPVPTSCYWDIDMEAIGVGGGDAAAIAAPVGLTTAEFSDQAKFVGWNFTDTWAIGDVGGVQRPYLKWQDMRQPATGISDSRAINSLNVYPNPVSGILSIENAPLNSEYRMVNIVGQTVKSGIIHSRTMRLNVSDCEKGVYLLRVGNNVSKILVK
ncbi:T9SS type A sorting domain-containing protein [Bacteroidota bacterium]